MKNDTIRPVARHIAFLVAAGAPEPSWTPPLEAQSASIRTCMRDKASTRNQQTPLDVRAARAYAHVTLHSTASLKLRDKHAQGQRAHTKVALRRAASLRPYEKRRRLGTHTIIMDSYSAVYKNRDQYQQRRPPQDRVTIPTGPCSQRKK